MGDKSALETSGFFSNPSFLGINDPYGKKNAEDSRYKGKQFVTSPSKSGRLDGYFEKFKPLYEEADKKGEPYQDPGALERAKRKEEKKKMHGSGVFVPSSPSKKTTGPGNYFGCFSPPYKHEKEYEEKPPKKEPEPKNILTSPSKKGTYGYAGTMIGGEFKYMEDPYDLPRKKEAEEQQLRKKKQIGGPFKSVSKPLDFFDSQPSVAASKIYTLDKPLPPEKEKKPEKKPAVPFRPSSPAKRGLNSTFSKFPEYKEDPAEERLKKEREERAKSKPKIVFRPVSHSKSRPTRPIMS